MKYACLICAINPNVARSAYCYKEKGAERLIKIKGENPFHYWVEEKIAPKWFGKSILEELLSFQEELEEKAKGEK